MLGILSYAGAQEYHPSASDFARLYVGEVEPQYQTELWYDNPYYKENTNVYQGRISYHGVVYDHVLCRFDQLKQQVVVLSPRGLVFCVPDQEYIDWFEMDGRRYVHDPEDSSRYASLLSCVPAAASDQSPDAEGNTNAIRLYYSEWKILNGYKIVVRENRAVMTLRKEKYYSIMTPDGKMHRVKRASDIAKLFPEQKKQIRRFVRQNHLSFSESEREKSLMRVVETLPQETQETLPRPLPIREGSPVNRRPG